MVTFINVVKIQIVGFFILHNPITRLAADGYTFSPEQNEEIMTTILQLNQDELRAEIKKCLKDSIEELMSIPVPAPLQDRITLIEACETTGLSRSLLYKKSMEGTIPHQKYGKRLIFSRKELEEWMEHRTIRRQSTEEIAIKNLQKVAKRRLR